MCSAYETSVRVIHATVCQCISHIGCTPKPFVSDELQWDQREPLVLRYIPQNCYLYSHIEFVSLSHEFSFVAFKIVSNVYTTFF